MKELVLEGLSFEQISYLFDKKGVNEFAHVDKALRADLSNCKGYNKQSTQRLFCRKKCSCNCYTRVVLLLRVLAFFVQSVTVLVGHG